MGNWNYDNCASWPLFQLFRVRASYNLIVLLIRVIQIGTWPIIFTRFIVNQLLFLCEKFLRVSREPRRREYFFDENQFLPNSYYHNNTKEDKTWSRKHVTAKQFIRSYYLVYSIYPYISVLVLLFSLCKYVYLRRSGKFPISSPFQVISMQQ